MQRELTFYPEIERTRDLLYSEYTSQDRSIHVLLQDNSGPHYRFLLEAFREIVSRYLSTTRIQSPTGFFSELAARLEELAPVSQTEANDLNDLGLYVLLRASDGYYLFVANDDDVFVFVDGEALSLSQVPVEALERIHFDDSTLQEELFPHRFQDGFLLFRLDPEFFGDNDIVLGCGEEDKSTVLESLSDPLWLTSDDRRNSISSKFITRRILALRFGESVVDRAYVASQDKPRSLRIKRLAPALAIGIAAIAVSLGAWGTRQLSRQNNAGAPSEKPPELTEVVVDRDKASEESSEERTSLPNDTTALTIKWSKSFTNAVTSSPTIEGDRVIFGCRDGKVYALNRTTGDVSWIAPFDRGVGASPAIEQGTVVVADYGGSVSALAVENGALKWRRTLPARVVSSPAVLGDRVVVGCYDGHAYCLSMSDGTVLWKYKTGDRIRASAAASNRFFFVASYDGYLYALMPETGEIAWQYSVEGNLSSPPAVYNGIVVIGTPGGSVIAISAADGSLVWRHKTGEAVKAGAAITDGRVYIGSNDKNIYCLNAKDGALVWKFATNNIVLSRPLVENGVVYVGSYDGNMYCLEAGTGRLLGRFHSDGEIYSSPVIDDDSVYFGNNSGSFISLNYRSRRAL